MPAGKLQFRCPGCSQILAVAAEHAGKTVACPGCKTTLKLPEAAKPAAQPVTSPAATAVAKQATKPIAASNRPVHPSLPPASPFAVSSDSTNPAAHGGAATSFAPTNQEPASKKSASPSTTGRSITGLVVAGIVAGAFSILWLVVTAVTGMELGILAWGLGGAIGLTAGLIGRNPSVLYCGSTAAIAMASVLLAKVVMASFLMLAGFGMNLMQDIADFSPDREKQLHALADEWSHQGELDFEQQEYADRYIQAYYSQQPELLYKDIDAETDHQTSTEFQSSLRSRLDEMTPEQTEQLLADAKERHPEWIEDQDHYYAMLNQLLTPPAELDEGLSAHAQYQLHQVNRDSDQNYLQSIAPNEVKKRSTRLRELAAERLVGLDDKARDQAVRETMSQYPKWNPYPDAAVAMMEKMVREGGFDDKVAERAKAKVAEELEGDYSDFSDNTSYEMIQQLNGEIQSAVSRRLVDLDPDARQILIQETQARYPDWYGEHMTAEQQHARMKEAMAEIGTDGTFWGSLKAVFGLIDFLWLFLGASTAFGTAKKYGEAED